MNANLPSPNSLITFQIKHFKETLSTREYFQVGFQSRTRAGNTKFNSQVKWRGKFDTAEAAYRYAAAECVSFNIARNKRKRDESDREAGDAAAATVDEQVEVVAEDAADDDSDGSAHDDDNCQCPSSAPEADTKTPPTHSNQKKKRGRKSTAPVEVAELLAAPTAIPTKKGRGGMGAPTGARMVVTTGVSEAEEEGIEEIETESVKDSRYDRRKAIRVEDKLEKKRAASLAFMSSSCVYSAATSMSQPTKGKRFENRIVGMPSSPRKRLTAQQMKSPSKKWVRSLFMDNPNKAEELLRQSLKVSGTKAKSSEDNKEIEAKLSLAEARLEESEKQTLMWRQKAITNRKRCEYAEKKLHKLTGAITDPVVHMVVSNGEGEDDAAEESAPLTRSGVLLMGFIPYMYAILY
jgi:hypothetical protein